MNSIDKITDYIRKRCFQYAIIDSKDVVFENEVRDACAMNSCGRYGSCWTCPPAVFDVEYYRNLLTSFDKVIVFTTKHDLEDSFDVEGMLEAGKAHREIDYTLKTMLGEDKFILGNGSCDLCKKCTYPSKPCRNPDKAIVSVEAAGINVTKLSQTAGINYINGQNTVTYFSVVFFNYSQR